MGWLGWLAADCEQRRLFARLTCCQVVTMRMGWSWLEGVGEGKHTAELQRRRREARMKLSMRNGSTLMRPTISLLLSFFVVGAAGGSLTTKEGRMV